MRLGLKRTINRLVSLMIVAGLGCGLASGQTSDGKPLMSDQVFKNVVVLKGIPVDQFMDTMGMFSASLTLTCSACHVQESLESWAKYADDTPLKQTARRMVLMVNALNKNNNFRQGRTVTCWTCHRTDQIPESTPSLAMQYQTPVEDPNKVFDIPGRVADPKMATADQIITKYIQAVGGAQKVNGLTTLVAKGTYEGYDTEHEMVPFEVYAKTPNQMTTIAHMNFEGKNESATMVYDGKAGWVASPDKPVGLMDLTTGNLEGAKIDAMASFPSQIKGLAAQWTVSSTTIDDQDVYILMGTATGKPPLKLYFGEKSGLLVRLVRYNDTLVGRVPTQIDFLDYRDVNGIKLPFHWTTTWTDGQTNVDFTQWQVNVPIEAAKFAKPAALTPHK